MLPLTMKCRRCCYVLEFAGHVSIVTCPFCEAVNERPRSRGGMLEALARATTQRLRCDFHNAVNSYQHVLLDCPDEHEALWGLALCRYGVEYVDDPRTGRRMPTVHSVRRKPMRLDPDYLAAIDCAPEEVRAQYEQEAQYIDDAMAKIIELSEKCPPYDVFLCHKTTKPDSEAYTEDYNRAFDLYHELTLQGYKVFFAPKEMAGVAAGSDYEAAIYHALDTAKVMLLICSDADYLTSAWVRSEWTRVLEMADEREDKRLVPLLYGDFTPAKLPRELRSYRLECVTMDRFTAARDILRLLEKCCEGRGKVEEKAETVEERPAPVQPKPEKPAPVPENPVTEMKTAPVQSVSTYAPETDFETEIVEGGCAITKYLGEGGELNVPPTIGGRKVVEIG
ncbi:MAG: toll/interleukin-1 receptor domain-containing protein, partial [Clostridia bacterium]|nr:toll/interleukin-1 receptor domain-containing protein [Clostridia bacterium]